MTAFATIERLQAPFKGPDGMWTASSAIAVSPGFFKAWRREMALWYREMGFQPRDIEPEIARVIECPHDGAFPLVVEADGWDGPTEEQARLTGESRPMEWVPSVRDQ